MDGTYSMWHLVYREWLYKAPVLELQHYKARDRTVWVSHDDKLHELGFVDSDSGTEENYAVDVLCVLSFSTWEQHHK